MFVKHRPAPVVGSIPHMLQSFRAEVRFYREIAPVVGIRVPACHGAHEVTDGETRLELEDLSSWAPGAHPESIARVLAMLHQRWHGGARARWPWLRSANAGAELVAKLFDRTWTARGDLSPSVRALGDAFVGKVAELPEVPGPTTLVHGDASTRNARTNRDGEIVLLDWEDVAAAPGVCDLAWLLVSSVDPACWDDVIAAYGPAPGLREALPSAMVQGLLDLSDDASIARLEEATRRLL